MKLNFNFDGKTFLSKWWKIVRDNFTAIQTDHNTLSDKLDTEITQRTNADVGLADKITAETKARESADSSLSSRISKEVTIRQAADNELQRNIDSEITERQKADTNISNSVKAEESARKSADKELKARIDEINANTETTILFGEKKQHTVKFVAPSKPTLYFDGQQEYDGESMTVDITLKDAFYIDGKQIAGTFSEPCINVPIDGVYIVVRYDFSNNMCSISSNSTSVPSAISGDVWTFTLYHINDINLEMKIDSESPTGERYEFISAAVDYVIENENATGDSYFITNPYERVRTLADLATVNKNSFIDAVNENAKKLTTEISDRMDGHDSLSDRINTETGERQAADMQLSARINSIGNKAPLNHASTGTTYGVGDATNYGHLKLSDSVSSSNSTGNGCAATPKAVKTAYDKAVSAYELADGKLDANFISNSYIGIDEVTSTLSNMWGDRVAPPTTITISSSTSKHMLTADYYCSGTNDQTVINNAISALPSTGGKIVLLEGTYNISGQINVNKPNVTICGMGNSTVLECKQGIWGIAATQTNFTIANLKMTFDTYNGNGTSICIYASGSRCKFENLDLSNAVYGINCGGGYSIIHKVTATVNRTNIHLGSGHNVVSDCYSENAKETGIRVEGEYNIVTGCHISDNATYGILVTGGGKNKIAGNIIKRDSYSDSQYSIYVTSSTYNSCSDNIMIGKNYTNAGGTTNTFDSNKY